MAINSFIERHNVVPVSNIEMLTMPEELRGELQQLSLYLCQYYENNSVEPTALLTKMQSFAGLCFNHVALKYPRFEMERWLEAQKQEQYGGSSASSHLTGLRQRFQTLANVLHVAIEYVNRVEELLNARGQNWYPNILTNTDYFKTIARIRNKLFSSLYDLLNDSFMVTMQPSIVLKTTCKTSVQLQIVGAIEKFGFHVQNSIARCQLISFEEAKRMKDTKSAEKRFRLYNNTFPETHQTHQTDETVGCFDSYMTSLSTGLTTTVCGNETVCQFKFETFKLSKNQAHKPGQASKQRYVLAFCCSVRLFEQPIEFLTFSFPFRLSEHPTMDPKLWAAGIGDLVFSTVRTLSTVSHTQNDDQMTQRDVVRWSELELCLRCVFSAIVCGNLEKNKRTKDANRQLNSADLACIKLRLLNGVRDEFDTLITYDDIFTVNLQKKMKQIPFGNELAFTFWEWFFKIAKMLQKSGDQISKTRFHEMWNNYFIEGFITQGEAQAKLQRQGTVSTFLMRFSFNNLAAISVVIYQENKTFKHVRPWMNITTINENNPLPKQIMNSEALIDIRFFLSCKPQNEPNQTNPSLTNTCLVSKLQIAHLLPLPMRQKSAGNIDVQNYYNSAGYKFCSKRSLSTPNSAAESSRKNTLPPIEAVILNKDACLPSTSTMLPSASGYLMINSLPKNSSLNVQNFDDTSLCSTFGGSASSDVGTDSFNYSFKSSSLSQQSQR